jgi:hypothetical protein
MPHEANGYGSQPHTQRKDRENATLCPHSAGESDLYEPFPAFPYTSLRRQEVLTK